MKPFLSTTLVGLAAAAALAMTTAEPAQASNGKQWQRKIAKVVAENQVYPRSAMRREIEGKAKVKVTVKRDGSISNFEILKKTGHEALDREVPKLIERVDPLPEPPSNVEDSQLTFIIPLAWVLR